MEHFYGNDQQLKAINLFHVTGVCRYPLKTSENQRFSCFQGVSKETSGVKWVNYFHEKFYHRCLTSPKFPSKVNKKDYRKMSEICSKQNKKLPILVVNFKKVSDTNIFKFSLLASTYFRRQIRNYHNGARICGLVFILSTFLKSSPCSKYSKLEIKATLLWNFLFLNIYER